MKLSFLVLLLAVGCSAQRKSEWFLKKEFVNDGDVQTRRIYACEVGDECWEIHRSQVKK